MKTLTKLNEQPSTLGASNKFYKYLSLQQSGSETNTFSTNLHRQTKYGQSAV